jgi:hypothetical protein
VIGHHELELPSMLKGKHQIILFKNNMSFLTLIFLNCLYYLCQGDTCYACPRNKDHNSIQVSSFKKHIQATHPPFKSNKNPPEHTIIIEADITSSIAKNAHQKINKHLRQ